MGKRETILELLRTRNLGGGQQGVMEWQGKCKRESEIPLSGDLFQQAFGVAVADPDAPYISTREARSREILECAIEYLVPCRRIAINAIFDRDVGGYGDLEFYTERAPNVAAVARKGIDDLVDMLEDADLYVSKPREMTEWEEERQKTDNQAVYDTWVRRRGEGAKSKDVVAELWEIYGVSERRIYQILEQMTPPEEKSKRGRPRKEKK